MLLFEGTFTSFFIFQIRIQEAQKHVDPLDPDPDSVPDLQHWLEVMNFTNYFP